MSRYEKITELADYIASDVVSDKEHWMNFLNTASKVYKYPFQEQLLIYAQKPEATACASIEIWNKQMNCWVKRGSTGIVLIDKESQYPKLKYVFDVSDVVEAPRIGHKPNLWDLQDDHKDTIIQQLENIYGVTDESLAFEERLIEIAQRVSMDYYDNLILELSSVIGRSALDRFNAAELEMCVKGTLVDSVSYILLARCGTNMNLWKDAFLFEYIHEFNTKDTLYLLGDATAELCKPILMEIGKFIRHYEEKVNIKNSIENTNKIDYNTG